MSVSNVMANQSIVAIRHFTEPTNFNLMVALKEKSQSPKLV